MTVELSTELKGSLLTDDQARRVEALQAAREILSSRAPLAGGGLPLARSVVDLQILAEWVMNGPEPDELGVDETRDTWRLGYAEGVRSAVTSYRRLGDGDAVLTDLLADHAGEPNLWDRPVPEQTVVRGEDPRLPDLDLPTDGAEEELRAARNGI